MKIISYGDYVDTKIESQIDFVKDIGVYEIILRKVNEKVIYNLDNNDLKTIISSFKKEKINIFALDPLILAKDYYTEVMLDNYFKTIDLAVKLNINHVIFRLPLVTDIIYDFKVLNIKLNEIVNYAKKSKITILIKQEGVNNNVLAYIMKKYNEKYLRIIFSPKDAILNNDSAISGYRILKDYFDTFIAADLDSKNNPELLGYGRVDIIDLFKRMKRDGYQGDIILDDTFISFFNNKKIKEVPLVKRLFRGTSILDKYLVGYKARIFNKEEPELPTIYDIYMNQINVLNIVFK